MRKNKTPSYKKRAYKNSRLRKTAKGWVYFSCQVPPAIKKKLQELYKELIKNIN